LLGRDVEAGALVASFSPCEALGGLLWGGGGVNTHYRACSLSASGAVGVSFFKNEKDRTTLIGYISSYCASQIIIVLYNYLYDYILTGELSV